MCFFYGLIIQLYMYVLQLDSRYNEIMCELLQESDSGKHTSKKERVMEQDNSSAK